MSALLIINADDFGLTPGVNRGIAQAFETGVLTSTSMLAVAPAFDDAVGVWRDLDRDGLGIGVHFALVGEDPPLLSAAEIPTLVDRRGRFWESWKQFLPRAATRRIDPDDVRAELRAQLERIVQAGIAPTHVDTHQHLHLWPVVRNVVLDLARDGGIDAIRVPRPTGGDPKSRLIGQLARQLATAARGIGLRQPEAFVGLDESGRLDLARLHRAIERATPDAANPDATDPDAAAPSAPRPRSMEIGCHPGLAHDPDRDRYRWGFSWPDELAALCHPDTRTLIERRGLVLGSFAAL